LKSFFRLPKSGDSVPNVLIFFRDSEIIAAIFLFETLLVKTLVAKSNEYRPYLWIQSAVTIATTNRFGELLLTTATGKVEDAADLVESVKKLSTDEIVWLTFCKLIDRLIFFVCFILYFFMFISLLPEGYLSLNYDPIENLS
jgi:hypothetical protein